MRLLSSAAVTHERADAAAAHLAREWLAERYTMALGTRGDDGPWVAAVYFAEDIRDGRIRLYFLSSSSSRHCRNIALDGRVSAAINEDEHQWQEIRGVQLSGTCAEVTGREQWRAWRAYLRKFHFVRALLRQRTDPAMAAKMARTTMYGVAVEEAYYLDNRRGFGNRVLFFKRSLGP
jgi:uncharacterized protein